jgi:[acyl-carrier-protein] S-malonyltransferase
MLSRLGFEEECVFLFPGVGMKNNKFLGAVTGLDMNGLREACRETHKVFGTDVWNYINGGEEEYQDKELVEQISIYTVNCFVFREYLKKDIKPGLLAGYSMGLYSALYCGGAVKYGDGIDLVATAYNLMKDFSEKNEKWGMAIIVGLDYRQMQDIINALNMQESVYIINENNQHSIVISGLERGIDGVCLNAAEEGALNINQLSVSLPYHTRFMIEPAEKLKRYFNNIQFKDPVTPLVSAITQDAVYTADDVKRDLFLNLKTGMSWMKTIEKAGLMGFKKFAEVGLSDSLCKMSSFINPDCRFLNCKNIFKEELNCAQ